MQLFPPLPFVKFLQTNEEKWGRDWGSLYVSGLKVAPTPDVVAERLQN